LDEELKKVEKERREIAILTIGLALFLMIHYLVAL